MKEVLAYWFYVVLKYKTVSKIHEGSLGLLVLCRIEVQNGPRSNGLSMLWCILDS